MSNVIEIDERLSGSWTTLRWTPASSMKVV